jgi:tRNA-2-methylthio-N6-dimethylallyladenosine synthase
MSLSDRDHLAGMLGFNGYELASNPENADILVLNTCIAVGEEEDYIYEQLANFHALRQKNNPTQKIFLFGCLLKYKNEEELKKRVPFLDGFFSVEEARKYPRRNQEVNALVVITRGCSNFCSYCILPHIHGQLYSRPAEDILTEINSIDFTNYKHLSLIGLSPSSYTGTFAGKKISFASLLKIILQECPQVLSLGALALHPKDVTDELVNVVAENKKINHDIYMAVQSGNDRILQLMNRGHTTKHYRSLLTKFRASIPNVRISTDIIVGFPSETEDEFMDTYRLVEETGVFCTGVFGYSPRQGTTAASLPYVPQDIIDDRLGRLLALLKSCGRYSD